MNERIVSIAQELARSPHACTLEGLASEHGVSQRTIRNDVKALNRFLAEQGLGEVRYAPGGALVLPVDFSDALSSLPRQGFYSYKLSSSERKMLAAAILTDAPDYLTLGKIATYFSVSRTTVLNDLDGVKSILLDAGLEVVSRPNRGVRVDGHEINRRGFLLSFSLDYPNLAEQWFAMPEHEDKHAFASIIGKILNEQSRLHRSMLDDRTFRAIKTYLYISVRRCREGRRIERFEFSVDANDELTTDVYSFAHDVIDLLGQYCGAEMGDAETAFFARMLDSWGYRSDTEFKVEDVLVQSVTRRFVHAVSETLGIDFDGDYDLFELLSNHLESMFATGAPHFPANPALREVVTDQPVVLDAVKDNLGILEEYSHRRISEVETIYVALHICAALERRKNLESGLRVVLVCDEGVGSSRMVAEELRGRFDIRIVKVIAAHEVPYIGSYQADLVISTVPLESCVVDHVVVTLPFTDRDYTAIRKKIDDVRSIGVGSQVSDERLGAQGLLDRIEPIIRREVPNNAELIRLVRTEVRRYFQEVQHLEEEMVAPYLHQLLPEDHILLDVPCSDWRDAISKAAQPLLDLGYIEPRYVDAMIANVECNGPYIVLAPHFAIPHEAPEKGAHRVGMSLIRLAEPVSFDAGDLDPVEFVCVLSAVDRKTHLKAFFNLLSIMTSSELHVAEDLRAATSPAAAALVIENAEYQVVQ